MKKRTEHVQGLENPCTEIENRRSAARNFRAALSVFAAEQVKISSGVSTDIAIFLLRFLSKYGTIKK